MDVANKIRMLLNNRVEEGYYEGISLEESSEFLTEILYSYLTTDCQFLYDLNDIKNADIESDALFHRVLVELISSVIYLDAYKQYRYMYNKLLLDVPDIDNFEQLKEMNKINDVNLLLENEPAFYSALIELCVRYYNTNDLTKHLIVRSLNDKDNRKLLMFSEMHREDLATFGKANPITAEGLLNNYRDYYNYLTTSFTIDGSSNELNLMYTSFIKELNQVDPSNAKSLCLSIAKKDYLASKYLLSIGQGDGLLKKHIYFYMNNNKDDIYKHIMRNDSFLNEMFDMFINVSFNEYYNGILINKNCLKTDEIAEKIYKRK